MHWIQDFSCILTHILIFKFVFYLIYYFSGFSVVAPELAIPGKTTAVLVTLQGPRRPVNVTLRLVGDAAEELNQVLLQSVQEITGIFYDLIF